MSGTIVEGYSLEGIDYWDEEEEVGREGAFFFGVTWGKGSGKRRGGLCVREIRKGWQLEL